MSEVRINMIMLRYILGSLLGFQILMAQGYTLKTQHITQSQGQMSSNSLKLVGTIGSSLNNHNGTGDTLSLSGGFLSAVNGI